MRRRSHALVIPEAAVLAGLTRAAQRVRAGPAAGPARAVAEPALVAPLDRLRSNTCPAEGPRQLTRWRGLSCTNHQDFCTVRRVQ